MKDKINIFDFALMREDEITKKRRNKLFNLDDEALKYSTQGYILYSNPINSSKLFKAVIKSDLKRIENFKEKFDLEKFKQRSKKYNKLGDYWHKNFDENFLHMIEVIKKYMRIPYFDNPEKLFDDATKIQK